MEDRNAPPMAAPNATPKTSQIRVLFVCPIKIGTVRWPWAVVLPANSMNAKNITAQKQTRITIGMTERAAMTETKVPKKTNIEARVLTPRPAEDAVCDFVDLA